MQEVKYIREREAVLLSQRDVQAVIGGAGLKLKIEGDAEALAQCQPPGLIDARAKRRMNNELHAAAFIEETLGNDGSRGRDSAQNCSTRHNVFNKLLGAGIIQSTFSSQPLDGLHYFRGFLIHESGNRFGREFADALTQFAYLQREFFRAARGLAQPEGNGRRRAMRIFHQNTTGALDATDAPARVAK